MEPESKVNILLVDDNPNNLSALEAILSGLGQNLVRATSGKDALRCLLQQDFAVILLDVKMPEMDGFETASLIRTRERSRDVPIIFLTAYSHDEQQAFQGYSLGAVDYLVKPVKPEILLSKVAVFVELFKKTDQIKQQAAQIAQLNTQLELRVRKRTAQLEAANQQKDELLKREQLARSKAEEAEASLRTHADELSYLTTALTQTNILLEKRNKELDQFVYAASHDLKSPLRAIANIAQWLGEDFKGQLNEETQYNLNLLQARVHRMENLIDGLLQYHRVGRAQMKSEIVDVKQLLFDVIDSLDPPSQFTIEIASPMPTICTVRVLLEQVFANLIGNAIRHHDKEQGTIQITARQQEDCYEFAVTDDGPGIDPQFHDKIFGLFQTLRPHPSNNTGIGLALVKKIVDGGKGTISIDSQENKGTTVRFTWFA